MMKNNKILLLLIVIVILTSVLCGCSLFKLLGWTGTEQLATPANIVLSEDATSITWDVVPYAVNYEIYVDGQKIDDCNSNVYNFEDLDGEISLQLKAVSESKKYTESELSTALTLNVKSKLIITGLSHLITDTDFIIFWADLNYALKYSVEVYADEVLTDEIEVFDSSIMLNQYNSESEYSFKIQAIADNSGKRVDSKEYIYTIEEGSGESTVVSVEYDKNAGAQPSIDNLSPSAVKIYLTITGVKTDITSNCIINEDTVTIKSAYINTLDVGVYNGEFDSGRKRFALIVRDTRDLVLENIDFVKNAEYAYIDVDIFGNSIISIELEDEECEAIYDNVNERIVFTGEDLDALAEDEYTLNVEYGQGSAVKSASASINVITLPATIAASLSYDYYGQYPLTVDYTQNGDTVTSLVLADYGTVNATNYDALKNQVVISREFLIARGNGTYIFCINTEKGSALSFTVITDIRDFALQYSNYTYDKADDTDMTIGAIIVHPEDFEGIFGATIDEDDYYLDDDGIILDQEYVENLSSGEYEFICISDGVEDYFVLNVIDSDPQPYDVKLNYDINSSNVYITFKSDSAGNHTYSFNGGAETTCPSKKFLLSGYDKTVQNTLRITCVENGKSTTITKSAPVMGAMAYINSRFTFEGENHDKYIESQYELNHFVKYLIYNGYDETKVDGMHPYSYVEESFWYSPEFLSTTDSGTALNAAFGAFSPPWGYEVSTETTGNSVNVTVNYTQYPGYNLTTEYIGDSFADSRDFLVESSRSGSFNNFYIETRSKTQAVRNTMELVELPFGVKPVVEVGSDAETLYEAAKDICRDIIEDSMTEFEKVTEIYAWIVSNVTYDRDSIDLYNLYMQVKAIPNAPGALAQARSLIDSFISSNPDYSELLTPIRNNSNFTQLQNVFNSTIKRMRVFAAEGAIIDRKAVCNGIAYALMLLCKIEGVECIKVSGTAYNGTGSENHAWNKVNIDDVWYLVDATWGRMGNYLSHKYLLVSDFSVFDSHREEYAQSDMRNIECLATGHNDYYSTVIVGEYDLQIDSIAELEAVVEELYNDGIRTIELKYNIDNFSAAIGDALSGLHSGSYQTTSSNDVYIVNLS